MCDLKDKTTFQLLHISWPNWTTSEFRLRVQVQNTKQYPQTVHSVLDRVSLFIIHNSNNITSFVQSVLYVTLSKISLLAQTRARFVTTHLSKLPVYQYSKYSILTYVLFPRPMGSPGCAKLDLTTYQSPVSHTYVGLHFAGNGKFHRTHFSDYIL